MSGLAAPLASPLFEGGGISTDVPGRYDCALDGIGLMIDWKKTYYGVTRFGRQSLSLLKPQQDTSGIIAESSLNPAEFARRAAESWHHGAGQTFHDRSDSDPARFRSSKGIDPWTQWQITLLPDSSVARSSANTNLAAVVVGSRLYVIDGNKISYTTDLSSFTDVTGVPAANPTSIATDGFTVYTAHTASGIYTTTRTGGAASSFATGNVTLVGYVKGRLMAAYQNNLYNVTGSGALPTALLEHPNTDFVWVGFAEGPSNIYAAGYSGHRSVIYRTAVQADGTALTVPTVAGELPTGEIIRSICGYLGYLLVGTDKGVRLLSLDANGDIASAGRIIPTGAAVGCLEPQDRFVWYGLTNYDTVSTGLGRLDLGQFTDNLTPAWASDLMTTAQGAVTSVCTFASKRVFAVSGVGFIAESANKVSSGMIDSGLITYGLPDTKVALYVDTRFDPLVGSVASSLSANGGSFALLFTAATAGSTSAVAGTQTSAETFEVRLSLTRDAVATLAPVVRRWTIEANPAPGRGEQFDVPFLLFEEITTGNDSTVYLDVTAVYQQLLNIENRGAPVVYQDAFGTFTVVLDDHEFLTDQMTSKRDGYQGTFVAHLRRPRSRS